MSNEDQIEQKIKDKGLNAPRLNPEHINSTIESEEYHIFAPAMTVCCLTLKNGFQVIGQSAAASPENFDEDIGREIAFNNARQKIWELEGYLLRQKLFEVEH